MDWLNRIFRRNRRYAEISQSIRGHLEEKIEVLMEKGMSWEVVSRAARLEFGGIVTRMEERSREVWQWPKLESVWADLRLALQQFIASPAFAFDRVGHTRIRDWSDHGHLLRGQHCSSQTTQLSGT